MTPEWVAEARGRLRHFELVSEGTLAPTADKEWQALILETIRTRALVEIAAELARQNDISAQALGISPIEVEGRIPCPICGGVVGLVAGCRGCNGNGFVYFPPAAEPGAVADPPTGAGPALVPPGAGSAPPTS